MRELLDTYLTLSMNFLESQKKKKPDMRYAEQRETLSFMFIMYIEGLEKEHGQAAVQVALFNKDFIRHVKRQIESYAEPLMLDVFKHADFLGFYLSAA